MTAIQILASCAAIALAYVVGHMIAARLRKSRCCGAPVKYVFGWDYRTDGYACTKCRMLQD